MKRSSRHYLDSLTKSKIVFLDYLFPEFQFLVQKYIDLIWEHNLELRVLLSSKLLPDSQNIKHSQWKQVAYKQASEIVRSQAKKKKKIKPVFKNVAINIDSRLIDIEKGNHFDLFVKLKTPFFHEHKKRAKTICLPVNQHKQSLKYSDWERDNTVRLSKNNNGYFIDFSYEKEIPLKTEGESIAFDCGYKKMFVDSNGKQYGKELFLLYQKIAGKKQRSHNFKQALSERDNKINKVINAIDLTKIKQVIAENLKYVKHKTKGKFRKQFVNKLQRWTYKSMLGKLERMCEENGVLFTQIDPAYSSQECSCCHAIDKASRRGEFYKCTACLMEMDADENAARVIKHRGSL